MLQGVDMVGGMPHAEANLEDAQKHIDIAFEIAKEFDADVDMHIDETDDSSSRTLELLAETTIREGYQGRVIAGHCCALAAYPDEGHGFPRRADRRRDALQRALDWMDFYLKGAAVSTTE